MAIDLPQPPNKANLKETREQEKEAMTYTYTTITCPSLPTCCQQTLPMPEVDAKTLVLCPVACAQQLQQLCQWRMSQARHLNGSHEFYRKPALIAILTQDP
jgi:hypothetical protein